MFVSSAIEYRFGFGRQVFLVCTDELLVPEDVRRAWDQLVRKANSPRRKDRMILDMICPFSSSMMNFLPLSASKPS